MNGVVEALDRAAVVPPRGAVAVPRQVGHGQVGLLRPGEDVAVQLFAQLGQVRRGRHRPGVLGSQMGQELLRGLVRHPGEVILELVAVMGSDTRTFGGTRRLRHGRHPSSGCGPVAVWTSDGTPNGPACLECVHSRARMGAALAIDNSRVVCAQNLESERLLVSPRSSAAAKSEAASTAPATTRRRKTTASLEGACDPRPQAQARCCGRRRGRRERRAGGRSRPT